MAGKPSKPKYKTMSEIKTAEEVYNKVFNKHRNKAVQNFALNNQELKFSNREIALEAMESYHSQFHGLRYKDGKTAGQIAKEFATPVGEIGCQHCGATSHGAIKQECQACGNLRFSSPQEVTDEDLDYITEKIDEFLRNFPEYRCLDVIGKYKTWMRDKIFKTKEG